MAHVCGGPEGERNLADVLEPRCSSGPRIASVIERMGSDGFRRLNLDDPHHRMVAGVTQGTLDLRRTDVDALRISDGDEGEIKERTRRIRSREPVDVVSSREALEEDARLVELHREVFAFEERTPVCSVVLGNPEDPLQVARDLRTWAEYLPLASLEEVEAWKVIATVIKSGVLSDDFAVERGSILSDDFAVEYADARALAQATHARKARLLRALMNGSTGDHPYEGAVRKILESVGSRADLNAVIHGAGGAERVWEALGDQQSVYIQQLGLRRSSGLKMVVEWALTLPKSSVSADFVVKYVDDHVLAESSSIEKTEMLRRLRHGSSLADVRVAMARVLGSVASWVDRKRVAIDALIDVRGTAIMTDAAVVRAELMRLPERVLNRLIEMQTKIVVVRGSVLEVCSDLRGERTRGWPPGAGWDTVSGMYDVSYNEVIIATREVGGVRAVPQTGQGHASMNLVVHETMQAYDHLTDASDDEIFRMVRTKRTL